MAIKGDAGLLVAEALARWAFLCGPAVLALLWLFVNSEDRGAVVATAIACLIGLTAAFALSSLIVTPRPFMDGPAINCLDHVRDSSFPSDHATLLFAIAFAFWVQRPASLGAAEVAGAANAAKSW